VDLGFLDFSTLEKRRHFCDEEVRLNRRLAPQVYLDVVPITCENSVCRIDSSSPQRRQGTVIEWAVKMQRLPDDATLESRLRRGDVTYEQISALAHKIAGFHASAQRSEHI